MTAAAAKGGRSFAKVERRFDLLAIGNPCIDLMLRVQSLPALDDKVLGTGWRAMPGGTEANVACAASRLGLRSACFGHVGGDAYAGLLRQAFAEDGVDETYLLSVPSGASAMAVVMVSPGGQRSVVYVPAAAVAGPAGLLRTDAAAAVRDARLLYTMPYDSALLAAWAEMAAQAGTEVAIDLERAVAADPDRLQCLLRHCDIALFNEAGFRAGTALAPDRHTLRAVQQRGRAHTVVVTRGADGASAVDAQGWAEHGAYATTVRDTTGAGDTFNAAFLAARSCGAALHECLSWGCAAASLSVAAEGARAGMPSPDAVRRVQSSQPGVAAAHGDWEENAAC